MFPKSLAITVSLFVVLLVAVTGCFTAKAHPTVIPPTATIIPSPTNPPLPTNTPQPTPTPLPKLYGNFSGTMSSPHGFPIVRVNAWIEAYFWITNSNDAALPLVIKIKAPWNQFDIEAVNAGHDKGMQGDTRVISLGNVPPRAQIPMVIFFAAHSTGPADFIYSLQTEDGIPILNADGEPQGRIYHVMIQ